MSDPVVIQCKRTSIKLFEMLECEVTFDDNYFHHVSQLTERDFHDAYDADEDFTLFRADAFFTNERQECLVPVFASKDKTGTWKWLIRFRPHRSGHWNLKVRVLCWHQNRDARDEESAKRTSSKDKTKTYFEHDFGYKAEDLRKHPGGERRFTVNEAKLAGPLEVPDPKKKNNHNYFYRWTEIGKEYKRRPFFLLGSARPWVVPSLADARNRCRQPNWDSILDREKDLFVPMRNAGYNVLYHWMAPWETQLVHQSQFEYWPNFAKKPDQPGVSFTALPSVVGARAGHRLTGGDADLGYKRYDQGRAAQTDLIFNLAAKHHILLFVSVIPHQSLQDPPHHWGEWGWSQGQRGEPFDPSKVNGFQLFARSSSRTISTKDFFMMDPSDGANDWKRKLWKHFANYWRYVLGRWTAHPVLGAWILLDELEGVGEKDTWWWDNQSLTYRWHDNVLLLIRGKLRWKSEGKDLPYIGDYLNHPLSTSTTYYEYPLRPRPGGTLSCETALGVINNLGELPEHGTWRGGREKLDFVSHHTYQYVPAWEGECRVGRFLGWHLPNTGGSEYIKADRWLWDSLCMRLRNWGKANDRVTRIVTEYGCWERVCPEQKWNHFGERTPSLTHFANWAAFMLGHAGIPFKWNDGKELGEMIGRPTPSRVWVRSGKYPVDNYAEITNVAGFLKGIALDDLEYPEEFSIVDESDAKDKGFNAWALMDSSRRMAIAWLYDRTFSGIHSGFRPPKRWLKIERAVHSQSYRYDWFDTWKGTFITEAHGTAKTDKNGILKIPLPRFPKSDKTTVRVSHGNDIAIRLTVDPYRP